MQYANGREIKLGDMVVGRPYTGHRVIAGTVMHLDPEDNNCLVQTCVPDDFNQDYLASPWQLLHVENSFDSRYVLINGRAFRWEKPTIEYYEILQLAGKSGQTLQVLPEGDHSLKPGDQVMAWPWRRFLLAPSLTRLN